MSHTHSSHDDDNYSTRTGRAGPALLDIWIFFNLVGNTILLPILLLTFVLAKRARRHATLVNLLVTWIFSGIFANLLSVHQAMSFLHGLVPERKMLMQKPDHRFFANKHYGPEPPEALCIAQSSLLYGITPMWSVSVLMLFWFMSIAICGDREKSVIRTPKLILMLASPYVVHIAFFVAALVLSLNRPDDVTRHRRYFYCSLHHHKLALAMSLFTIGTCVGIIHLEVRLAITAYRHWWCLKQANKRNGVDFYFYLRVLAFGAFVTFGMIVNLLFLFDSKSLVPDIFLATAGAVVFLIFGIQCDVLSVWCYWRPPPPPPKDPVCEFKRTSFWRRSEATFQQDLAEVLKNLPPSPPLSKEDLIIISAKAPNIVRHSV
ncbi:hypothetical protein D9619_007155 [Psilocybe cf. subviscida]|uniref:Uncharacterized protein n=1 Tax=Psilocybe cf. subviscida TaxID=2480587 RepID=A0A8H5B2X9_9AGAR|nr:hypothetical protein D9619_007155 [Psilocybe cf. subviscida]